MRIERVPSSSVIESEVQTLFSGGARHPVDHQLRFIRGDAVLVGQVLHISSRGLRRGWSTRIQFEGPPHDFDLVTTSEASQGSLEATLTDVAPGTHNV